MSYQRSVRRLAIMSILYFSSMSHLVSAQSESSTNKKTAGKHRSLGEVAMSERRFNDAASHYSDAIAIEPDNAANYYKLYRVHSRMRRLEDALTDITSALTVDPSLDEYRLTKAKLLISLGQCEEALPEFELLNKNGFQNDKVSSAENDAVECASKLDLATKAYADENWSEAVRFFELALAHMDQAIDYLFMKAQAEFHAGDYYGTVSDTGKILKTHSKHLEAYQLRGEAYMRLGEHDTAVTHFREALKMDPEHSGCKKGHKFVKSIMKKHKRGDDAFSAGEYRKAIGFWWEAMNIDMTHLAFVRPCLLKVVKAHTALGEHDVSILEANKHIENMESVEGFLARGDAELAGDMFEEAVRSFSQATDFQPNDRQQECKQKLDKAKVALKQSKEKNYYKVLGVARNANKKEIKKAYRDLALKWHPDKAEDKEKAKIMFQDISEAYEVLSDDENRGKYDRGEDVFENQGGGGGGHGGMHEQMFRQHFSQGGGGGQRHFRFN
uniref:J domain-containing protein n=1 Tax=Eucampia antarctica TaxID=49252 RepID=A0A7S2R980_9STRA|mmetsp:Transcript_19013/g.18274  ORF Transcript_19013/g.18274 Transcript_19013/m.18274 type:complete len:498 (+) Transcript_19013:92-1585(+)|eukprot:CAMPEP_0197828116 /NCGR_PEP_ID=MMETSP1437-20131217/4753_1 /TAXON_ID=49252 ORGANISM="Eucampia antarctica, Strain CCMP1452" /NCGR_SAMPLE_ID=MMETSP1437 /ASSEMBLY_ACC=CAM_ASM_001096 /LENGTH=497 /DNA_ID=CAMNT_0043429225 /DNA_START=96 /DNA_END=1589 /DNA_ORIENTATION=-